MCPEAHVESEHRRKELDVEAHIGAELETQLGHPRPSRRRLIERRTERGAVRWWKVAHRHRPRGLLQSRARAALFPLVFSVSHWSVDPRRSLHGMFDP